MFVQRDGRVTTAATDEPCCMASVHGQKCLCQKVRREYRAAARLAVVLHAKHYPEVTQWQVGDDLETVILQIDNMTAGMVRDPAAQ